MLDLGSPVTTAFCKRLIFLGLLAGCADRALTDDQVRDADAPRLDVRQPQRGSIAPGDADIEVRGNVSDAASGVAGVTVNGQAADVHKDGTFIAKVKPIAGITLLHTVVTDNAGNTQSDTRAVLGGNLVPVENMVSEGIMVTLDRNALKIGGQLAAQALGKLDIASLVMDLNPLVDVPVPCLGARVDVSDVKKGVVKIDLAPIEGGLQIDAEIADVSVGLHVAYDVGCDKGTADISMRADGFHLRGALKISLDSGGEIVVDASEAEAAFDGFNLDASILPSSVENFVETPIGDALGAVVAMQVRDQLPPLIKQVLGGKDQVYDIEEYRLDVAFQPTHVSFTDAGVTVAVDSRMLLEGSPGAVYLSNPSIHPTFANTAAKSIRFAVADDALNQMLSSLWSAGIFNRQFVVDNAGNYGSLGKLFDRVEISMRLPPVVTALPSGGGMRISVGDVECNFVKTPAGEPPRTVTRLSLSAETTLTIGVKDNKLSLNPSEPTVWLDILSDGVSGSNPFDNASMQELGSFVAKNLVGYVGQKVSNVPIPVVEDMTIVDASVSTGDSDGGYVIVPGNVKLN